MGIGEILTYVSVAIFALGMVTFAVVYRRLLLQTMEEYTRVKIILRGLITTLHKLKGRKGEPIVQRILSGEAAQAKTTQEIVKLQELERNLVSLMGLVQTASASDRKLMTRVMEVQREVQKLTKTQEALQRRINTLNGQIQQGARLERNVTMIQTEKHPLSRITETERLVLNLLVEEGPMTAPKVKKKIEKTREHTARLMQKLWQEGYVERDTHRKPFTYKLIKNVKKKKTMGKKAEKKVSTITKKV